MKRASSLLGAVVAWTMLLCIAKGHAQSEGPNGHYYKVVLESNLSWEQARLEAAASAHNGLHGHLATITSQEEDQFINLLRHQSASNSLVWIGGSQHPDVASVRDGWSWVNGEGSIPGENDRERYAHWRPEEPDGSGRFLALGGANVFGWSSESENSAVAGYVVEYAGAGTANSVWVVAIDPIATEGPVDAAVARNATRPDTTLTNKFASSRDIAIFEFRREGDLSLDLPVFYSIHGTASNGTDYDEISKSIIIPAGERSVRLNIIPRVDSLPEKMDTVGLRVEPSLILTPEAAYRIHANAREAGAVIYDLGPPAAGALQLIMTGGWDIEFKEGEDVVLLAALSFSNRVSTVDFWSTDFRTGLSNKLASVEAISRTNEIAFYRHVWTNPPAGTHFITTIAHTPGPGSVRLASFGLRVHVVGTEQALVSIRAVPPDEPFEPPNSDFAYGHFEVSRIGPTDEDLQVHYTVNGSGTAGFDYEALPNYVVIGAGRRTARITLNVIDDSVNEPREFVELTLVPANDAASSAYRIDKENATATIWIFDNERYPPPIHTVVSIEATLPDAWEGQGGTNQIPGEFTVRRAGNDLRPMTVYLAIGGTASRDDYIGLPNLVLFEAGKTEVKLPFIPVADNLEEEAETVIAELVAPPMDTAADVSIGYRIDPERRRAVATIHDGTPPNIPLVSVHAPDPNASEPNPNPDTGEFVVRRSGPTNTLLRINWAWGGSARLREDYVADTNSVTFLPGQRQVTRVVTPLADRLVEGTETVAVELVGIVSSYNTDPANRRAEIKIQDAVAPPTNIVVSIEATRSDIIEPVSGSKLEYVFALRRTGPTNSPLPVKISYRGTATFGVDYHATNTVVIPAGAFEYPWFSIRTFADNEVESPETIVAEVLGNSATNSLPYQVDPENFVAYTTLHDSAGTNTTRRVVIVKPADGATFLLGEPVPVEVHAFSPGALITKLELQFSPTGSVSTTGPLLEAVLGGFELGEHTFQARATDSLGNVFRSAPVRILVRHRDEVSFVRRNLPETYAPGFPLMVELQANPPEGTHAYSVEDVPPEGWVVSDVSHGGSFDAVTGKVKFGPFTDGTSRALTYRLTPPSSATGRYKFEGNSSINGALYPISGDDTLEMIEQVHPADQNGNFAIVLTEVTAYAAAWKSGETWPTGPNPIPLSYVTSAGWIWKSGEAYRFDPDRGPAPRCWVPVGSTNGTFGSLAVGEAGRSVPNELQAGGAAQISIAANPPAGAASYAVEETPPRGWAVSDISHEGTFDPEAGVIRWGVFFDATPRTLSYTLTPPAGVASWGCINGELSFDGKIIEISSAPITAASGAPMRLSEIAPGPDGLTLSITGPAGQTAVIESTSDFARWDEVQSIFIPGGEVQFKTGEPATGPVFYRLRVE